MSAQNSVWSTHDRSLSIVPPVGELPFHETWADVKAPGGWPTTAVSPYPANFPPTTDRRNTYVVGTIEVNRTDGVLPFSSGTTSPGTVSTGINGPNPFNLGTNDKRQVVMTQWNSATSNANFLQVYFYGLTGGSFENGNDFTRATNARAISVWETGHPSTTRIAICGETYDHRLLHSQAFPNGWALASASHPSGFIAVYSGAGELRWTHHFFNSHEEIQGDCAITDVSIRVDGNGDDVVTYCGISTHGGLGNALGELEPKAPFLPVVTCSGGQPTVPPGQWDAFVGRVVSSGSGTSDRVFHSIVSGGPGQDLLMGIAELDENRFAVVGSTEATGAATSFPFKTQCGVLSGPFVLGTVMVFDASGVGPGSTGNLVLESSQPLGTAASGVHTVARDVCVGRAAFGGFSVGDDLLYVVGSTDDASFKSGVNPLLGTPQAFLVAPPVGQDTLQGSTDGFVAAMWVDRVSPDLVPWTFTYHGGSGNDGLTGVNGWSEFSEHLTVTGFTDDGQGAIDIDVGTYFFNNAPGLAVTPSPFTGPPNFSGQLLRVRRYTVGGGSEDRPAVMGQVSASTNGQFINGFQLGQESGGGVAVGNDGRVNVVGRTTAGGGYPVFPPGVARGPDQLTDAVRTEFDPVDRLAGTSGAVGTGRTDGTGFQGSLSGFFPPAPATGLTGGTTPFCALSEFGVRNGVPPGAAGGWLPRMLIDVEGDLIANSTNVAVLVSRPTTDLSGVTAFGGLQFGFPPTTTFAHIGGTEYWLGGGTSTSFVSFPFNQSFRLPIGQLYPGLGPVSAQLTCLLVNPIPGPGGCSTLLSASPALWFTW